MSMSDYLHEHAEPNNNAAFLGSADVTDGTSIPLDRLMVQCLEYWGHHTNCLG